MAVISNNDIARAIYLAMKEGKHETQSNVSKKVIQFLSRRRILSKAPLILTELKKIIDVDEGRVIAKVSSVEKLDHQAKTHLEHSLKKRYGSKEVVLNEVLDSNLVGGIKIEVNNEVIDLSIKNRLRKLQEYLTK